MLKHAQVLLVGLVLAAVVLPASSAGAVAGYGDVDEGRYFTDPVQWSVDGGVTGVDGACFEPDRLASRGEMAVWLWNMEGQPSAAEAHSFTDVTEPGQQDPVSWLLAEAITTGTTDTTFSPDNGLTRGQFAAFLWRLAGRPSTAAPHSFGDVVATWQQDPVSWLLAEAITTGTTETTFSPADGLTRGQLVTFLYRYNGEPTVTVDPTSPACTPPATFKTVTAGGYHSCALRSDDTITCWGAGVFGGQSDAPSGTFKTVTASGSYRSDQHSCGVRSDDTITCWGVGVFGGQSHAPSGTFKTVTAGNQHSCGVRSDDTIACWGASYWGQSDAPSGTFKTVNAGVDHSCGLRSDDTIACWGANIDRSEGPPGMFRNIVGQTDAPSGTFKTVNAGDEHSCGVRSDDTITCWGGNDYGQTDAPSGTFKTVSAAVVHSCGVRSDDTITCWGGNDYGETDAPSGTFKTVSAGGFHSCGLRADDTITCWGYNYDGQADAPT